MISNKSRSNISVLGDSSYIHKLNHFSQNIQILNPFRLDGVEECWSSSLAPSSLLQGVWQCAWKFEQNSPVCQDEWYLSYTLLLLELGKYLNIMVGMKQNQPSTLFMLDHKIIPKHSEICFPLWLIIWIIKIKVESFNLANMVLMKMVILRQNSLKN